MPGTIELNFEDKAWNPEELKTPELCLAAVQKSYRALKYVPEALKETIRQQVNPDCGSISLKEVKEILIKDLTEFFVKEFKKLEDDKVKK